MGAFREFKSIWDPANKLNPHKVVEAYLPTENLRLGADYAPLQLQTHFAFPDDGGSLAQAALRCVGLGECRKHDSGSMCPSYMVTLEEQHSTRGRAHMLFELLQGEVVRNGWQDEDVKRALDLCLSCKACKSECPTNVDIATYRAEFLSHYYEGQSTPAACVRVRHGRPVAAVCIGRSTGRQPIHANARARHGVVGALCTSRPSASCRGWPREFSDLGSPRRDRARRQVRTCPRNTGVWQRRASLDRHVQQPLSSRDHAGGDRGPARSRHSASLFRHGACVAGGRCTTSACSITPEPIFRPS